MRALFVVLSLLVSSAALADCPWEGKVERVTATMTTVTVNGRMYSVKGQAARAEFMATLADCDVSSAAVQSFADWRGFRRATNITGGVGLCCFFPVLLATPVTAFLAGEKRDDMLAAMLAS